MGNGRFWSPSSPAVAPWPSAEMVTARDHERGVPRSAQRPSVTDVAQGLPAGLHRGALLLRLARQGSFATSDIARRQSPTTILLPGASWRSKGLMAAMRGPTTRAGFISL